MKKGIRHRKVSSKPKAKTTVTEEDLLKNFEKYQKVVQELESRYSVLLPEEHHETPQPAYVSEPLFFYRVHASI